jgi:hypothetical protein
MLKTCSFLLCLSLGLGSCRQAELSEGQLSEGQRENGKQFLSAMDLLLPNCKGLLRVRGEDIWSSWILRVFTPLKKKRETFDISTEGDAIHLKLGDGQEFSYHDGVFYRLKDGVEEEVKSSWDQMYVESLSSYLRMAFVMQSSDETALLSAKKLGSRPMTRLYFSENDDQYVAYFDAGSSQIEGFRFTSRAISRSYKGWIRWQSMQNFGGMFFPARIVVQDTYEDSSPIHELHLTEVSCEPAFARDRGAIFRLR